MATVSPTVRFNTQLLVEDMAIQGLTKLALAKQAGVSDMSVIRFLSGERQTAPMAKKLSGALGYSVRRYIVPTKSKVA